MDGEPLSERFVRAALATSGSGDAVRPVAARTLFDFWACALAGKGSGDADWPAGHAGRLALAAHRCDLDDLHFGSLTHPGGVVWSAVTACAVECGATLAEAMRAAAFGYELTVRLAEAYGADHRKTWHVTATAGTIGAAGAAALLASPADPGCAARAVGHALSVTSGSAQAMVERSGTRFLHRAHAAETGVACARAARAGLPASRLGLEGGRGAFGTGPATLADDLLRERGAHAIAETGFRLHAATGFAHAAIAAAASLGPLDPAEVARVRVDVAPAAVAMASNPVPANDEEAWWSIQHAVAISLSTGSPPVFPGASSDSPAVLELCRRVEVVAAGTGWAASVEVEVRDGDTRTASVDAPRGHPSHPASDADLLAKWERLTGFDGAPFLAFLQAGEDDASLAAVADQIPAAASLLRPS